MHLEHYTQDNVLVVRLSGKCTSITAASFQSRLSELVQMAGKVLVLDAKALEFISSAGLRAILKIAKDATEKGKSLSVCSLDDNIQKIFKISGFDRIIAVYSDLEEAMGDGERARKSLQAR